MATSRIASYVNLNFIMYFFFISLKHISWLYFIPPYTYHDIAADKDGYVRYGDNVVFIFLISQYKICIH